MKIYDISQEVFSCVVFPGDPKPERKIMSSTAAGDLYNLTALSMCAHNGTHLDAPFHFLGEGKTVDQLPLETFVGESYVARHEGDVTAADAQAILEKANGIQRILLAGRLTVTAEAAQVFADSGILLLGNESQTVGPENAPMQVHLILLGKGIVLLEGIVLKDVPEGRYFLSAAPLNLGGADGAPCRAYLIQTEM
jgi:arylformamidase